VLRHAAFLLSAAMVVIGVAMLAVTLASGGGPLATGVIFGVLFLAAGLARLHILRSDG
jgi:hypothetical protein